MKVRLDVAPGVWTIACRTAARPDVCTLANNHVLDFGARGFTDTLNTLAAAAPALCLTLGGFPRGPVRRRACMCRDDTDRRD